MFGQLSLFLRKAPKVIPHVWPALTVSDIEKQVHVIKGNFCNGIIRWQISKSLKVVSRMSALALTYSEILTFQDFDLQKVGQMNFLQLIIRWQKSKSINVSYTFLP